MSTHHKHYRDYRDIRGDGRIVIYRRADTAGDNWTARLKVVGNTGYVVKSTRSTNDYEARRFAEDLYYELEGKARRNEPIRSPTFARVFQEWKTSLTLDQKLGRSRYIQEKIRQMELWGLPNLGSHPIASIDSSIIDQHIQWRVSAVKRPPAIATLRNERTVLNQLFQFAKARGYRRDTPLIRLPAARQVARPDIPELEWKKLLAYLPKFVANAKDKRRSRERFYLHHYIVVLGNSGIRVGEARKLTWKDISSTQIPTGEKRIVLRVSGKTGAREVVCNNPVDRSITRLRGFRTAERGSLDPNEPVFCDPSGRPIGSYKKGFETVLAQLGILCGPDGKRRVPYSLRHTYATMRLAEDVNIYHLAVNMGTSVKMIEDFYGKRRVRNPRIAAEITKVLSHRT